MNEVNILFSSVGRRVELVKEFKKALKELNMKGNLVGIDISENAPAMHFVDKKYLAPKILEEGFIDFVIEICKKERINLIIPIIDRELLLYSENKEYIKEKCGATVMISDIETMEIVRNKIKTCEVLDEVGVKIPKVITKNDIDLNNLEFPLFIKPLDGSASVKNFKVENKKELKFFGEYVPNPIIQEFIEGDEYCVDMLCDFNGEPIHIVPKLRIAHSSGEITTGKIVKDREIIDVGKLIAKTLKFSGEVNFDCIKNDKGIFVLEINGRFAGGAPMSISAGAKTPTNLIKLLLGENLEYKEDYDDGVIISRFDDSIFINKNR